jgi:hypothetical protein
MIAIMFHRVGKSFGWLTVNSGKTFLFTSPL